MGAGGGGGRGGIGNKQGPCMIPPFVWGYGERKSQIPERGREGTGILPRHLAYSRVKVTQCQWREEINTGARPRTLWLPSL